MKLGRMNRGLACVGTGPGIFSGRQHSEGVYLEYEHRMDPLG
jgi:hypothetical protein